MKKQSIIISTLISTILSVVFILLTYYGITRYISLHVSSEEKYIKNYSKIPTSKNKNIILTFTCDPKNFKKLKPMLNSILDQTLRVQQIYFVMPYNYQKEIPSYVKSIATIFPTIKNYGECTDIIPVLLSEKEEDTIIISLNPNYVYGKDFIEYIIGESDNFSGHVINDKRTSTVLFKPKYFDSEIIDRSMTDFRKDWFVSKSKKVHTLKYLENYKVIKQPFL